MSVKTDGSGRRWMELEFEAPGTPEQVWRAIATGPGVSSWFAPTVIEERAGGTIAFEFGQGVSSSGQVTGWEPPLRFAYEERDWAAGAPPLATEFFVEARAGGVCVVRLVHSLFTDSAAWDDQMDGFERGWPPLFEVMRLYLTHFDGQSCAPLRFMAPSPRPEAETWAELKTALGLADAAPGEHRSAPAGAPPLAGEVERGDGGGPGRRQILLRLDEPAPGLALIGVDSWDGAVHAAFSLFFYGDRGAQAAARDEPRWRAWIDARFPPSQTEQA